MLSFRATLDPLETSANDGFCISLAPLFLPSQAQQSTPSCVHPPPVPYPRSLTASTARVDCPRWHLPVCSLRSLQKSSLASAQAKKSEPLRTNWSPDCPPMGLFQECPRWGILTQHSNNPRLRFRSSRFRADFTQTQLRPPQPPMTRKRKASALQCKISIPFPRALQVYLLGLLAMIKCSICSYQCDN